MPGSSTAYLSQYGTVTGGEPEAAFTVSRSLGEVMEWFAACDPVLDAELTGTAYFREIQISRPTSSKAGRRRPATSGTTSPST